MHFEGGLAQIWTLNSDDVTLELQTSAGRVGRAHQMETRVRIGESRLGLIAKERVNYLSADVAADAQMTDPGIKAEKMRSLAGCPLIVENRLLGLMVLYAKEILNEETLEFAAARGDIAKLFAFERGQDGRKQFRSDQLRPIGSLAA